MVAVSAGLLRAGPSWKLWHQPLICGLMVWMSAVDGGQFGWRSVIGVLGFFTLLCALSVLLPPIVRRALVARD